MFSTSIKCFSCAGVDVDGICYWTSYYSIDVYLPGCSLYKRRNVPLRLMFSDGLAEIWFNFIMKTWTPRTRNIVFIPCAMKKPYWTSITHRCFFRKLWDLWFNNKIDLVVLSEPLTVVPVEFDFPYIQYPLYEYPPDILKRNLKEQSIWRSRLSKFLKKLSGKRKYAVLYRYHKKVLGDILKKHGVTVFYTSRPYIVKTVSKTLQVISATKALI